MKLRYLLFALLAITLAACNFSLAEDITPPPNYVPPTPMPTLGPLYPPQAPDTARGASIYAEKCAPCHGPQGMGDGAQGKQLPLPVAALGLPQFSRSASPEKWFTVVSRGNIERFMPPFASLDEQQRWDVVAYALSLHTTEDEVARGKQLFETNCANCPLDAFQSQEKMASLSADDIVALLKNGGENVTAISGNLGEEDYYAIADYLRTLTFYAALPTPTPEPATPTATVAPAEATPAGTESALTPAAEGTPATEASATPASEATATPLSGMKISGQVEGGSVSGITVTLHGYEHSADGSGASEVVTQTAVTGSDGKYVFEGLELNENRIYVVDTTYQGVTYSSDLITPTASQTDYIATAFKVYDTTEDYSTLSFDQAHFFFEFADQSVQVIGVYTFTNPGDKTIVVKATIDVPFIKTPADAQNVGFDLTQESAPLVQAEGGFGIPPSEKPYGIVVSYSFPYNGKLELTQALDLPAKSVLVLVPDGVKLTSDQLAAAGTQAFNNATYLAFQTENVKKGDEIGISLSGKPKSTPGTATTDSRQGLVIGVGALGAVLIAAGAWLYLRDRRRASNLDEEDAEDEEEDKMETEEDLLDAIIALDDLHRSGKISDDAYRLRRAELKSRLKNVM